MFKFIFPSTTDIYIFCIVFICWVSLDMRLLAKKKRVNTKSKDKNSAALIIFTCTIAIWMAFFISVTGIGFIAYYNNLLFLAGTCLMLLGVILRHYSIHILGRYFTIQVQIQKDHNLVEAGPYKYIRHPSYTGSYIILLGLGIALHNWIAFLLLAIPSLIVTLYRVSVEEKALTECFGDKYKKYMRRTGKFIPNLPYIVRHF